jgi:hypothetical protein
MTVPTWAADDTDRAMKFWAQYQETHDVSDYLGQTVGIDPASSRVWFGESARAVVEQARAEGVDSPLYCVRVGSDYYYRKGRRR